MVSQPPANSVGGAPSLYVQCRLVLCVHGSTYFSSISFAITGTFGYHDMEGDDVVYFRPWNRTLKFTGQLPGVCFLFLSGCRFAVPARDVSLFYSGDAERAAEPAGRGCCSLFVLSLLVVSCAGINHPALVR